MRVMEIAILSMMLVGCSTGGWVPGPNATPNLTFDQQDARCSPGTVARICTSLLMPLHQRLMLRCLGTGSRRWLAQRMIIMIA
jgi:hypothetical protein